MTRRDRTPASHPTGSPAATGPLERSDASLQTILPVLKTFSSSEVAIIGCHASRMSRQSCEYDLLLVGPDPMPQKFTRVGDAFARVIFTSEREVRNAGPELAVELARAVPLRDNSLLLGTVIAHCRRTLRSNCRKATESSLAAVLKALGRVDELLPKGDPREADLWLLAASREFARAELLSRGVPPSPSHVLSQMKGISKRTGAGFTPWAESSGLERASRASCENRLEALTVLYDVLSMREGGGELSARLGRYRGEAVEVLRGKSIELLDSMRSVECFAFLGQEVATTVTDLHQVHCSGGSREAADHPGVVECLTSGSRRLISDEVIRLLGLVRTREILETEARGLKRAVASLAKRI